MDKVTFSCNDCQEVVGTFENLWDKIGKTYYSPITAGPGLGSLKPTGDPRPGADGTIIGDSVLQDLTCKGCDAILGLRCEDAPRGHILKRDQLILRIGAMSVVGKKIPLAVRNSYALKGPSMHQEHFTPPNNPDLPKTPLFPSPQSNFNSGELARVSEESNIDLVNFARWAEETIDGQRQDIDRISGIVDKIEKDMHDFKDFLTEMRRQFQFVPKSSRVEQIARDLSSLQDEILDLREAPQLGVERSGPVGRDKFTLDVDELDVLSASISNISQKANEVDSLKIELQFMKTRLKRLEDAGRGNSQTEPPETFLATGNFEHRSRVASSSSRKTSIVQRLQQVNSTKSDRRASQGSDETKRRRSSQHSLVDQDHGLEHDPISIDHPRKRGRLSETSSQNRAPSYTNNRQPSRLSETQHADELNSEDIAPYDDNQYEENFESLPSLRDPVAESKPQNKIFENVLSSSRRTTRRYTTRPHQHENADDSTPEPTTDTEIANNENSASNAGSGRARQVRSPSGRPDRSMAGSRSPSGVRLTKHGKPDKRAGNYRNLKAYYDKLRSSEESDAGRGEDMELDEQPQLPDRRQGEGKGKGKELKGDGSLDMRNEAKTVDPAEMKVAEIESEDLRKIALEARERLVTETLQREL